MTMDEVCEEINRGDDWREWPGNGFRWMRCAVFWKTGTILICFRTAASAGRCQHLWLSEPDARYFGGAAEEALNTFEASNSKKAEVERSRERQKRAGALVDSLMRQITAERGSKSKKPDSRKTRRGRKMRT